MSPMTHKTRSTRKFGGFTTRGSLEQRLASTGKWEVVQSEATLQPPMTGSQSTDSEGHPWPPSGGGDVGGPFFTVKQMGSKPHSMLSNVTKEIALGGPTYDRGRFRFARPVSCPIETITVGGKIQPKWPTALNSPSASLTALGATAISRCRPTAAEVDLSTAVGETYRDGLPKVVGSRSWRERTLRARNAGDEYLNVEFGWAPLLSDIQSFGETVRNSDRIIKQYERDRGRLVRRSYFFPVERTETEQILSGAQYPDGLGQFDVSFSYGASKPGVWYKRTTTVKKRWFKGAFVYGAPLRSDNVGSSASAAEIADRLYGTALTPDVLWNLTPWSWALDWVSNTGDVLAYIGDVASQGLVMQYGYFMENTVHKVTYSLVGSEYHSFPMRVPNASLVTETKSRSQANPFGFGITWDGLSTAQAAILAAIGITR
jgi:hypothetical protein